MKTWSEGEEEEKPQDDSYVDVEPPQTVPDADTPIASDDAPKGETESDPQQTVPDTVTPVACEGDPTGNAETSLTEVEHANGAVHDV